MKRDRLWSVVFGALVDALEKTSEYHKAKMEDQPNCDGFVTYKGTIDVTSMTNHMVEEIGAAIEEHATYERLKAKFAGEDDIPDLDLLYAKRVDAA